MLSRLAAIPHLNVTEDVPLSDCTRFHLGGAARWLIDASSEDALRDAIHILRDEGVPHALIGGGSNLVAADEGYPGAVLRYTASAIRLGGSSVHVEAGAALQDLVESTIDAGLRGLETMTGIPGWVGGAIYGNAGAYGHSIQERVDSVRFFDGAEVREIGNDACDFRYRESVFKRHKDWIILSATLRLDPRDSSELRAVAEGILKIRNQKYPPSLRCAGSIFKNLLLEELPGSARSNLPASVIREGKVPSGYYLEQVGAKGMQLGGIRVADYHANLIYNAEGGTATEVRSLIERLKRLVEERYQLSLEEEVQYLP